MHKFYTRCVSTVESTDANRSWPGLEPVVISAPFGNYLRYPDTTPTFGTFTLMSRGGRPAAIWRCMLTLRYYRRLGAWVNRIGLRNPGIAWMEAKVKSGKVDPSRVLVSIHGFDEPQWMQLLERAAALRPMAIELNLSCPNVGEISWPASLFPAAAQVGVPVIAKLPPVRYEAMAGQAMQAGLTRFHACNTLPVPGGGMSGRPLLPVAVRVVRWLRQELPEALIVGGGGVQGPEEASAHLEAGADRVALGSALLHPRYLSGSGVVPRVAAAVKKHTTASAQKASPATEPAHATAD